VNAVQPVRFTLRLTNTLAEPRTVVLEPWSGEYTIAAGTQLDVVVEGTPRTPLEVELDGDRVIVYGFDTTDSLLTAYRDGHELRSEPAPPAG
jgi:hypothetical protein